jgi:hypothetical protein
VLDGTEVGAAFLTLAGVDQFAAGALLEAAHASLQDSAAVAEASGAVAEASGAVASGAVAPLKARRVLAPAGCLQPLTEEVLAALTERQLWIESQRELCSARRLADLQCSGAVAGAGGAVAEAGGAVASGAVAGAGGAVAEASGVVAEALAVAHAEASAGLAALQDSVAVAGASGAVAEASGAVASGAVAEASGAVAEASVVAEALAVAHAEASGAVAEAVAQADAFLERVENASNPLQFGNCRLPHWQLNHHTGVAKVDLDHDAPPECKRRRALPPSFGVSAGPPIAAEASNAAAGPPNLARSHEKPAADDTIRMLADGESLFGDDRDALGSQPISSADSQPVRRRLLTKVQVPLNDGNAIYFESPRSPMTHHW